MSGSIAGSQRLTVQGRSTAHDPPCLHALHRLEQGRLGVASAGSEHVGVDLTYREHLLTGPLPERRQRGGDLIPAAALGRTLARVPCALDDDLERRLIDVA
jgi:hypothetical protein